MKKNMENTSLMYSRKISLQRCEIKQSVCTPPPLRTTKNQQDFQYNCYPGDEKSMEEITVYLLDIKILMI